MSYVPLVILMLLWFVVIIAAVAMLIHAKENRWPRSIREVRKFISDL